MVKKILKQVRKMLIISGAVAVVIGLAIKSPQIHGDYIRNKVGSQVVILSNKAGNSGGTGFAVQTPSGDVLTLTNAHVCGLADETGTVYAKSDTTRQLPLKVIEVYDKADLCLLEGLNRLSGLKIANGVDLGEELGIVGHPKLMPLTLTRGELIGYANVAVLVEEGPCENDEGMYKTVDSLFGPVCVEMFNAGFTNIPSLPGNSGSPVVNIFGNVTGVLFAGDSSDNWGVVVPLDTIKEFLKDY